MIWSLLGCSHDPTLSSSDESPSTPTNTVNLSSLPDGLLGERIYAGFHRTKIECVNYYVCHLNKCCFNYYVPLLSLYH